MTYSVLHAKPERNTRIVERRDAGEHYKSIAADYGLSVPRARQIVERHRRKAKERLLMRVSTADELRDLATAIENQTLMSPIASAALPIVRNCVDHLNLLARVHELNHSMGST